MVPKNRKSDKNCQVYEVNGDTRSISLIRPPLHFFGRDFWAWYLWKNLLKFCKLLEVLWTLVFRLWQGQSDNAICLYGKFAWPHFTQCAEYSLDQAKTLTNGKQQLLNNCFLSLLNSICWEGTKLVVLVLRLHLYQNNAAQMSFQFSFGDFEVGDADFESEIKSIYIIQLSIFWY